MFVLYFIPRRPLALHVLVSYTSISAEIERIFDPDSQFGVMVGLLGVMARCEEQPVGHKERLCSVTNRRNDPKERTS